MVGTFGDHIVGGWASSLAGACSRQTNGSGKREKEKNQKGREKEKNQKGRERERETHMAERERGAKRLGGL